MSNYSDCDTCDKADQCQYAYKSIACVYGCNDTDEYYEDNPLCNNCVRKYDCGKEVCTGFEDAYF